MRLKRMPKGRGAAGTAEEVEADLQSSIKWHEGSIGSSVVEKLLSIGKVLEGNPRVREVFELASARFGRRTVLDEYSKVRLVSHRSGS